MKRDKRPCGLPEEILFQHLDSIPQRSQVTFEFLEQNVWWWRQPDIMAKLWIEDASVGWPVCDLRTLFPPEQADLTLELAQALALRHFPQIVEGQQWWANEIDSAMGYEWESRHIGCYPDGASYICLSRDQRKPWIDKYWKLNLNAVSAIVNPEDNGEPEVDLEKWTKAMKFNLRHGDDHLIQEFKKMLAAERARLNVPKPQFGGANRRPLERSWGAIEAIDIKTRTNLKVPLSARQRESQMRKALKPNTPEMITSWNLTVKSSQHPTG